MSQKKLAKEAKVDQSYISKLEKLKTADDKNSPSIRTVINISIALGVCPYMLMHFNINCKHNCTCSCNTIYYNNTDNKYPPA